MTLPDFIPGSQLSPLARTLAARIAATGPLPFHDFVAACLYDPGHGYYTTANPLGRAGDFITAPEISQVFGELAGLWAGEVWRDMGEPAPVRLIELGPGRGTLMADALRALRVLPSFKTAAAVELVETSEPLRRAQQEALASAGCAVSWHRRLEDVPLGPTILIANEFLDCLPVQHFVYDAGAGLWRERCVDFDEGRFKLVLAGGRGDAFPNDRREFTAALAAEPEDGDILEHRPAIAPLVAEFKRRASHAPFAALIIDYGYDRPSFGDTVQAVKAHRFVNVFDAPGEADVTAHVDFPHLKECAAKSGLRVFGPMPMGEWLLRLGLGVRADQLLKSASGQEAAALKSGIVRLTDPSQMGVLFKVMVMTDGDSKTPPPFS
jgi:NADH dehydrogenase [ubiquinone] 1 alpha subcomplex assembly factor 7